MTTEVKRSKEWLTSAPEQLNLATHLSEEELNKLAAEVIRTEQIDRANRADWDRQSERAMKLAKQVLETKSFPWEGASNVKHPLITIATIQFAARAYPEICKSGNIVKTQITGDEKPAPVVTPPPVQGQGLDQGQITQGQTNPMGIPQGVSPNTQVQPQPTAGAGLPIPTTPSPPSMSTKGGEKQQRAGRIQAHMNWQLTQEMADWEAEMDSLLHVIPVTGQCYKKSYFSALAGHNISELVLPDDCVVSKGRSRDIKKARRITHRLWVYINEAIEKMRNGTWLDIDLGPAPSTDSDTDAPHEFLEQHCYYDLDGDGYKEPYIITVHKQTLKTVRVAARWSNEDDAVTFNEKGQVVKIKPDHYFTHYGFIPNPDGSMNYLGFGQLLEPLNEAINTSLNQLLDSGHLANAGGGFIGKGVRIRGGVFTFRPGKWQLLDVHGSTLKESILPVPRNEPSTVLFQLLGFLVTAGKEISSVQNILTGDMNLAANMPVGTAMALVEQGLKVFVAIYKRIYRSLTEEFKKLYLLNARFLDPKETFYVSGSDESLVFRNDYRAGDTTVMPVADPELSSDMQRILKAQALKELSGRPGLNEVELTRRLVRSIRPDNVETILLTDGQISGKEPTPWQPPPHPQQILAQAKATRLNQQAQEATVRLKMDMAKLQLEITEILGRIENTKADSVLKLAKAKDAAGAGTIKLLEKELDLIANEVKSKTEVLKTMIAQIGGEQPTDVTSDQAMGLGEGGGPAEAASPIQARAKGGPVEAGKPYIVGEEGPEVMAPGGEMGPWQPAWQGVGQTRAEALKKKGMGPLTDPESWVWADLPDQPMGRGFKTGEHSDWLDKRNIESFVDAARRHGVDPLTFTALGISESHLGNLYPENPTQVNANAHELALARLYGHMGGLPEAEQNIDYGARLLKAAYNKYPSDELSAAQAYSGEGRKLGYGDPEDYYFGKKLKDIDFWRDKPQGRRLLSVRERLKENPDFMEVFNRAVNKPEAEVSRTEPWLKSVVEANKDKDFVRRILNPKERIKLTPDKFQIPEGQDVYATHLMSYSTVPGDTPGENKFLVYPQVVKGKDGLKVLGDAEALRHAVETGEFIPFDNEYDAYWFSTEYKKLFPKEEKERKGD